MNRKAGWVNRRVVLARDLGLWTGLSVVVLAESGARDDPFWMRGACLLTLALAVWSRRSRPLLALALVGGAEIVILVVALGSTIGCRSDSCRRSR